MNSSHDEISNGRFGLLDIFKRQGLLVTPGGEEQYHSLLNTPEKDNADIDASISNRRDNRSRPFPPLTTTVFALALILLCALVAVDLGHTLSLKSAFEATLKSTAPRTSSNDVSAPSVTVNQPTGDELGHCGRSVDEARALGCIFDPMSWAWQRPECYHAELVQDFLARISWHFYLTNESHPSEEIPQEAWARGEYRTLWGPAMWHAFHCTYSWRKFHEAFRNKLPMDNDILQFAHTMHCDTVFLHGLDPKLDVPCDHWPGGCQTTEVNAGFNKCGWY